MHFTEDVLKKRFREVRTYIYRDPVSILPFRMYAAPRDEITVYSKIPDEVYSSSDFAYEGDLLSGRDDYFWLSAEVNLPRLTKDFDTVGVFDFGRINSSDDGFEVLLFVDGVPYAGVDKNHTEILLNAFAGKTVCLTFLLWTGISQDTITLKINRAKIVSAQKTVEVLYYRLWAMHQSIGQLRDDAAAREGLLDAAAAACSMLRWDLDDFDESAKEALEFTNKWFAGHHLKSPVTVHAVGHTHIDVAWLWRLKHTREKAIRSFSTVLRLMEEFPEYLFLQSQPQLYDYIKKDCPALYEKIKAKIAEGKWEPDGAMWLEADCNISSGESLARQLIFGIRFFKEEFGKTCRFLWLPDVFGYSWALPQLMRQAHIDTFYTTKISWNETNHFPNDLFTWRGIDGSEVTAYFLSVPDCNYIDCLTNKITTYNGLMNALTVHGTWKKFRDKDISGDVLLTYGYGDGGGGVTREMLKMRRELDAVPFTPAVKPATVSEFTEQLHKNIDNSARKPAVWDGELYLEFHRGTYTTQAENKKQNRMMENSLFFAEWLNAFSGKKGYERQKMLNEQWRVILRNQFHDIIPGSGISEVYVDSLAEYAAAKEAVDGALKECFDIITSPEDGTYSVINPSAFKSRERVFVPETSKGNFYDTKTGELIPSEQTDGGYFLYGSYAPLSLTAVSFLKETRKEDAVPFSFDREANTFNTPFYEIAFNESGQISRLYDKEAAREVLAKGQTGNILRLYDDRPTQFDAWNLDADYIEHPAADLKGKADILKTGHKELVIGLSFNGKHCSVNQEVHLYSDNRRIDFITKVDWRENNRVLRVLFPVDIRSMKADFDIQYGYAPRATHRNTTWEQAKFETVGHKWADLSESGYGVSLLNNCKYGYSVAENIISLTLLRSPKYPDPTADMGHHTFTYALLPHPGTLTSSDVIGQANAINQPPVAVKGRCRVESTVFCDNPQVQIDAVKVADDGNGLIVRLHDAYGSLQHFSLKTVLPIKKWYVCDLLEEAVLEGKSGEIANQILHPFEIRTYRLWF